MALLSLLLTAGAIPPVAAQVQHITALEAKTVIDQNTGKPDFVVLDLRTPKEYAGGHIAGAVLLDYRSPGFQKGMRQLDTSKRYLIYCRTGNRSGQALKIFREMGFESIYHLKDGIVDWVRRKLPLVRS
jgi:rhodanese-related sulfurtransferase